MSFSEQLFLFLQNHRGLPFRTMTFFNVLLEATVCGALLILCVLPLRRFLRGKLGSRLIYFAWLLVAVRLLLPVSLPNPAMNELRPALSTDAAARPIADQIRVRASDWMIDITRPYRAANREALKTAQQASDLHYLEAVPQPYGLAEFIGDIGIYTSYGWTGKWFFFGYLGVCGGVLLYMACRNIAFRRGLRRGRVCVLPRQQERVYLALCHRLGVKPLPVWLVDPLPCACLVGVIRPCIALPLSIKAEDLPLVLHHELCHYKARDHWWALERNLCCVVHWFNPLVWVAARLSRFDCELACDERVTAFMTEEQRVDYANTLVISAVRRNAPRLTVLATGMTMNGKRLKKRITSILRSPRVRRSALIAFAVLAVAITLLAFATRENRTLRPGEASPQVRYQQMANYTLPAAEEMFHAATLELGPIASGPEAAQRAVEYFRAGFLQNAPFGARALNGSVYHAPEGWYVFATMEGNRAFEMLLSDQGELLCYESRILEDEPVEQNGSLPINVDESMLSYFEQFAQTCFGQSAGNYELRQDAYDDEGRYLSGAVSIGGQQRGFKVRIAPYVELLSFYTDVSQLRTVWFTQSNVLYALWVYQRDELGMSWAEMRQSQMRVAWDEAEACWVGEMELQPDRLSAAVVQKLTEQFGSRDSYLLRLRYDLNGVQQGEIAALEAGGSTAEQMPMQTYLPMEEGGMPSAPIAQTSQIALGADFGNAAFKFRQKDKENDSFVSPPQDVMPIGEALQIALHAIEAKYGVKPEELTKYLVEYGYRAEADNHFATPYWQLDFMDSEIGCAFEIMVHVPDGVVVYLSGFNEGNG